MICMVFIFLFFFNISKMLNKSIIKCSLVGVTISALYNKNAETQVGSLINHFLTEISLTYKSSSLVAYLLPSEYLWPENRYH